MRWTVRNLTPFTFPHVVESEWNRYGNGQNGEKDTSHEQKSSQKAQQAQAHNPLSASFTWFCHLNLGISYLLNYLRFKWIPCINAILSTSTQTRKLRHQSLVARSIWLTSNFELYQQARTLSPSEGNLEPSSLVCPMKTGRISHVCCCFEFLQSLSLDMCRATPTRDLRSQNASSFGHGVFEFA